MNNLLCFRRFLCGKELSSWAWKPSFGVNLFFWFLNTRRGGGRPQRCVRERLVVVIKSVWIFAVYDNPNFKSFEPSFWPGCLVAVLRWRYDLVAWLLQSGFVRTGTIFVEIWYNTALLFNTHPTNVETWWTCTTLVSEQLERFDFTAVWEILWPGNLELLCWFPWCLLCGIIFARELHRAKVLWD